MTQRQVYSQPQLTTYGSVAALTKSHLEVSDCHLKAGEDGSPDEIAWFFINENTGDGQILHPGDSIPGAPWHYVGCGPA